MLNSYDEWRVSCRSRVLVNPIFTEDICDLEEQLHPEKRCGHLGDKMIVPISQHVSGLITIGLQFDLMTVENLVIPKLMLRAVPC